MDQFSQGVRIVPLYTPKWMPKLFLINYQSILGNIENLNFENWKLPEITCENQNFPMNFYSNFGINDPFSIHYNYKWTKMCPSILRLGYS